MLPPAAIRSLLCLLGVFLCPVAASAQRLQLDLGTARYDSRLFAEAGVDSCWIRFHEAKTGAAITDAELEFDAADLEGMPTPDLRPRIWEEFGVGASNYGKSLRLGGESAGRFTLSLRCEAGGAFALPRAWLRPMRKFKSRRNRMGQLIAWLRRPEQSPRIVFLPWLDRTQDYPKERPHELLVPSRPTSVRVVGADSSPLADQSVSLALGRSIEREEVDRAVSEEETAWDKRPVDARSYVVALGTASTGSRGQLVVPVPVGLRGSDRLELATYGGGDAAAAKLKWSEAAGAAVTLTGKRRVPRGQTGTQKDEPRRRRWAELTVQLLGPDGQPIVGERVRRLPVPMPFGTDALPYQEQFLDPRWDLCSPLSLDGGPPLLVLVAVGSADGREGLGSAPPTAALGSSSARAT